MPLTTSVWSNTVDALSFSRSLARALPEDWTTSSPKTGAANWTEFMAERLFEAARGLNLGVCSTEGGGAPRNWHSATKKTGWAREHLFDFTMYHDWDDDYAQPDIILEHENCWDLDAFMADFWKLMLGYAPLRVMIGYHRDIDRVGEYVGAIRRFSEKGKWKYPEGVEDLVLIGHGQMSPRGFRVLNRCAGSLEWVEWADLETFLQQEKGR